MRMVCQRVLEANVTVNNQPVGTIGKGLLVYLGVGTGDTADDVQFMADKIVNLRIFADEAGKMNRSALDLGAEVLVISQFTLYANSRRGRRPSFTQAAHPDVAEPLIEHYVRALQAEGISHVATGLFGAHMRVEIHNDGPVTIILDTDHL